MSQSQLNQWVQTCRDNLKAGRPVTHGLTGDQVKALQERYSRFEDHRDEQGFLTRSELVVTSLDTPRPIVHLMTSNHEDERNIWGSFWDQHCGGFSCVDTVAAGRMTSHLDTNYVPTAPEPQDVRDFYIHDVASKASYPMFPVAGYEDEQYSDYLCTMGLDTFTVTSKRDQIASKLNVFVHTDLPLEVWQVTLTNNSSKPRELHWFCRVRVNVDTYPFYYFVPRVVCEGVKDAPDVLRFVNHDKGNKHPRQAFMATSVPFDGFDMMGEIFDGHPQRAPIPAAVRRGQCFDSLGKQPYAGFIAAVQFNATLKPGESRTWSVAFGKCPEDDAARAAFLEQVRKQVLADSDASVKQLAATWQRKVSAFAIDTPDARIDRYFNVWSRYQNRGQARFIGCLDKVGYRDILQNTLTTADSEPLYTRRMILRTLQYQLPDGRAVRQYEKLPNSGHDARMYHDSSGWIPDTLVAYIKETGDTQILDEQVPFLDVTTLNVNPKDTASVYEHAVRPVRYMFEQTGYHGLCKIGYGDWNDALSGIGGDKGVSVWLSCMCVYAAKKLAELATFVGKKNDAAEFDNIAKTLTERINAHAWDGKWYIYAINGKGEPIGSSKNPEGKIHLNVNTWAIFAGVAAAAGREQQTWESIESLDTACGHKLLAPSYTLKSREGVGRIADQMPGLFENGSIYVHGEAFYLYALAENNRTDQLYEKIFKTLSSELIPDIATVPPHQQTNFYVGPDHDAFGCAFFSNFTGSVPWYRRTIAKVVGVEADFAGLRIQPCPPKTWNTYRVTRRYRNAQLTLNFTRTGKPSITLDGQTIPGNLIPTDKLTAGKQHKVDVTF